MPPREPSDGNVRDAGEFSSWLRDLRAALRGEGAADVPCGGCTACCTSSQFIHIGPEEADTLAHIPAELLFPAPRLPSGHVVLGYDERGHCPMLVDGRCSIYLHRPRACRTYDCRVFAAAGVEPGQPAIAEVASHWRFTYQDEAGRAHHDAIRAHAHQDGRAPGMGATELAVRAVEAAELQPAQGPVTPPGCDP